MFVVFLDLIWEITYCAKSGPMIYIVVLAGLTHPGVIAHYGVSYQSLEATAEQMPKYLVGDREELQR
jgi:hypothetical protein